MICTPPGNMRVSTRKKSKPPAPARKLRISIGHNPFEGHALHPRSQTPVWERRLRNSVSGNRKTEFPGVRCQTGVWERGKVQQSSIRKSATSWKSGRLRRGNHPGLLISVQRRLRHIDHFHDPMFRLAEKLDSAFNGL